MYILAYKISKSSLLFIAITSFFFKCNPKASFTDEEVEKLTDRIQNAGTEVVNAKAGSVSFLLGYVIF